ncbi:MAG: hypothetical protein KBA67_04600 [Leptotrichiaceae bacterium]|nr:hypothetical protein [Leptotrichiaceae bacterium]MBP6281532.1 hypothetical protein [Leptotrichiaceae bacterium]MBP7100793.1 hypothetical protein [Leptotrichiaceae bacterium]MBP7725491.1 hypothetical protein [Leptotrichiaceae bacterium]MBP9628858.1 hypothetical protein [Leptotrichiaceae bacterium]
MKKKLILSLSVLFFVSTINYSSTVKNDITTSLDAIEYDQLLEMEAQRKREFISEKGQLEVEVEDLKSKLV